MLTRYFMDVSFNFRSIFSFVEKEKREKETGRERKRERKIDRRDSLVKAAKIKTNNSSWHRTSSHLPRERKVRLKFFYLIKEFVAASTNKTAVNYQSTFCDVHPVGIFSQFKFILSLSKTLIALLSTAVLNLYLKIIQRSVFMKLF